MFLNKPEDRYFVVYDSRQTWQLYRTVIRPNSKAHKKSTKAHIPHTTT